MSTEEKPKKDPMERIADALERIADHLDKAIVIDDYGYPVVTIRGQVETYQG